MLRMTFPSAKVTSMALEREVRDLLDSGQHRRAVERVMRDLGPSVLGILRTVFRKDLDAADEAFSRFAENLWLHLGSYRGESSIRGWVFTVARNAAVSVTRDPWRRGARRLDTEEAEQLAEEVRTSSALRAERQSAALLELRDSLDLDEQVLLTLRLDEKLSWEEIARVFEDEGTVVETAALRKRFERIKTRLGDEARRKGFIA